MGSMEHRDDDVICGEDESVESLPDWAPAFRVMCRYLDEQGHLEALEEMVGLERRADSYRMMDVVMFLVAYMCADLSEGGLREFWYTVQEDQEKLAAWFGRQELPSSSSVSRFLQEVDEECAGEFAEWALGEGTPFGGVGNRPEAKWLDTWGDGWDVVDWDPKARLLRQRKLIEGEDYPAQSRFGPEHGARGQVGRKRGELKFVRGLMVHAGTSQWLGAYRQEGNGTLVEEMEVARQARETLEEKREGDGERPPIMRIDGEGGEVCVINGLEETGWCPLVRLKQYHLLERKEVREAIATQEPTIAEGTGTGPTREVFEIGTVPLTSNRQVDQLHRWDEPIEIRLVVSRYPRTEADEGPGKLIEGDRYELFGTYLPRERWPAEAVVDLYFGRATVENYFAGADREVELGKLFSKANPAGQHLATTVGLWFWNVTVELGDRLVEDEPLPEPARRGPGAVEPEEPDEPFEEEHQQEREAESTRQQSSRSIPEPMGRDGSEAELSESTLERLESMGMSYDSERGVVECAAGHYLAPTQGGKRDGSSVRFRTTGRPCRGCSVRSRCTDSTKPDFRKEVNIAEQEVPVAVEIRDGDRRAPIGVRPADNRRAGPTRIRAPGFLAAKRRKRFRRAARHARIRVTMSGGGSEPLAKCAQEHLRYRRSRQRLPRHLRRRYRRLSAEATVTCRWVRGTKLLQAIR